MITIFTTAKPFDSHNGIIQRNALLSWKRLHPDVEVILFGDDEGAVKVCHELGVRLELHVERGRWRAFERCAVRTGQFVQFRVWHPIWFLVLGLTRPLASALCLRRATFRRSRKRV